MAMPGACTPHLPLTEAGDSFTSLTRPVSSPAAAQVADAFDMAGPRRTDRPRGTAASRTRGTHTLPAHTPDIMAPSAAAVIATILALGSGKPPGERQKALLQRREPSTASASHIAIFAAGCFWGVELAFARLPGVIHVEVGYTGGDGPTTYRVVSTGRTGHAEAVRIGYDPSVVSYKELLGVL